MSIFYMPRTSAYGQNVKPAAGSLLYFYDAGTTTSKTVYSDYGETVALTQPVTADASGRFAAVYVSGNYKAVLTDPDGAVIWTEDNLVGRDGDVQDKGAFTSATNSSNYPSSGSLGDLYRVTETFTLAATSGSHALVDGDFIICNKNGATGIDADWEIILGGGSRQKQADFSSKNLLIDVAGNSSVTASADALNLLNSSNEVYQVTDIDLTFTMPTDIPSGVEKASHWYQMWTDEDESTVLVPDLTGTATLDSASKLVSTGMTFVTDGVTAGDIVYNTTDLTQGVVVTVDSEVSLTLDSDVFPDGDEDFLVRILSPAGLGDYTARIGKVYNNSSSNLDDSKKNGRARITTCLFQTANGAGSSSTKISKFATELESSDNVVVTVENSATTGMTVTANMDCTIYVSHSADWLGNGPVGISKNSNQLTTDVTTITAAHVMKITYTGAADVPAEASYSGVLKKGDVIRPHNNQVGNGTNAVLGRFIVIATEII